MTVSILTIRIIRKSEGEPTGVVNHPKLRGICQGGPTFTGAERWPISALSWDTLSLEGGNQGDPEAGWKTTPVQSYRPIGLLLCWAKQWKGCCRAPPVALNAKTSGDAVWLHAAATEDALYDLMTHIYQELNLKRSY
ncbi:hypothetical protein EVAR_90908_1 [Eumeta japonica]|uniref:Uncharacterized protein n=1 Tax=Eumeta variegata TaxID=151549 RepID=A0A4C2A1M0_EUMVA|nr:hypothetical protein EVAR_90908_1 [Eumeta japonica]